MAPCSLNSPEVEPGMRCVNDLGMSYTESPWYSNLVWDVVARTRDGCHWHAVGRSRRSHGEASTASGAAMSLLGWPHRECTSRICHIMDMQIQRTAAPWQQQATRLPHLLALRRAVCSRRPRRWLAAQAAQLEEWDIVLYEVPGGPGPALGRVASVAADGVQVERLEEDVANQVWIVHGPEERVPLAAVRATLAADYLQLVDPDRVSNPHGEHALEAYRLLDPAAAAARAPAGEAVDPTAERGGQTAGAELAE
ncbi:hypothetical protein ABPG77_000520 [Micractinium sp. CCAP 211/92]